MGKVYIYRVDLGLMISKKMESSKNSEQIGMIMNNLVSFGHYQPTIT
jgi:hypothetical protein